MDRLRALGRRWPWFDRALDMQERYGEVNGNVFAAAITMVAFLSLIPVILVAVAVVGFLSVGDASVATDIVHKLGLTGDAATQMRDAVRSSERARGPTSVVGFLLLVWSALGITGALAQGVRLPWQRASKGLRDRLLGAAWGAGAFVLFGLTVAAGAVVNFLPDFLPRVLSTVVLFALGLVAAFALMLWTFWLLGGRAAGVRSLVPGAVLGAVGYQVLTMVGTIYVPRLVQRSAVLGAIGAVFAILTWLLFFGRLIVYSSTLNAVLYERRAGTVTLEIQAPRVQGEVPLETTRGGVVLERQPSGPPPQ